MHRLPPIKRGTPLSWDNMIPCDVHSSSLLELRVYEKHFFNLKRVGSIEYAVSTVVDQPEASFEPSTKQFKVTLSFPAPDAAKQAPAAALAEAQAKENNTRPLERLGPTRDILKVILDVGQAVSELHPAAKIVFSFCTTAWNILERQEKCDASVERLVVGLARMLPFVDQVDRAAKSSQLQKTVEGMMNLIEDAARFVVEYKSEGEPESSRRRRLQGSGPSAGSA
ncbi:hypothetical protein BDV93DRAFT_372955 [Ceratobasidium sp. AG-I]|nr:hypothetical protein BDV93DRAFT_372955 [Ceratobasidium sp. AG-I]